jgi:hypothetical protein
MDRTDDGNVEACSNQSRPGTEDLSPPTSVAGHTRPTRPSPASAGRQMHFLPRGNHQVMLGAGEPSRRTYACCSIKARNKNASAGFSLVTRKSSIDNPTCSFSWLRFWHRLMLSFAVNPPISDFSRQLLHRQGNINLWKSRLLPPSTCYSEIREGENPDRNIRAIRNTVQEYKKHRPSRGAFAFS